MSSEARAFSFQEPFAIAADLVKQNRVAFLPAALENPWNPGVVVAMPDPVAIVRVEIVGQRFTCPFDTGYWGLALDRGLKFSQPPSNFPVAEAAPYDFDNLGYLWIEPGGSPLKDKLFPSPILYRQTDGIVISGAVGTLGGVSTVNYQFAWSATLDLPTTLPTSTGGGNDINTVLLIQPDGPDGSIILRDSSQRNRTVRWPNATLGVTPLAYIQSNKIRFFGVSGAGLPVAFNVPSASTIALPKDDWLIGAGDWTLDLLVTPQSTSQSHAGVAGLPNRTNPYGGAYGPFSIAQDGANFKFGASSTAGVAGPARDLGYVTMGTATIGVETHLEAVRSGSTIYLFQDGALVTTLSVGTTSLAPGGPMLLGTNVYGNSSWWNGSARRIRLSNTARHTAAFTPRVGAYCP